MLPSILVSAASTRKETVVLALRLVTWPTSENELGIPADVQTQHLWVIFSTSSDYYMSYIIFCAFRRL